MSGVAPVPVVIDTDGGIDDAAALWWALTDPRVDVLALLATWGNVAVEVAAATCARVLAAAGRPEIPIAVGVGAPLGPAPVTRYAPAVHGEDGLGGYADRWPTCGITAARETPAELLVRLTDERPGEIVLITLGPLSTTAAALRSEPSIATRIRDVVVMGGAVRGIGNALPAAEANIAHDPIAAAEVVAAPWPAPPLLVGLDVTLAAPLDDSHLELASSGFTPAGSMLADPLRYYASFYARTAQVASGGFACHDLLAAVAAVDDALIGARTVPLAVDTGGSAGWGSTVADLRSVPQTTLPGFHPWRVALEVDAARFCATAARLLGG